MTSRLDAEPIQRAPVELMPLGASREEVALLVAAAKSDRRAFEPLYRMFVDQVFRYCCRRLDDREQAADATSQVFIKAIGSIHTCDAHRFRSWLFAIAHNVLVDEYRSTRMQTSLDNALDIASAGPSPEDEVLNMEARRSVVELLAHLTPDQRQIVELRLAGLNGNEIADVLGRTRGAIDTAQSRAIARLRDVLKGSASGDALSEARNVLA